MIFIVGNSRSGTTMLGRILGNNSQVYTFGELHFFENQIDARSLSQRAAWSQTQLESLLERLLTSSREGLFEKVVPGRYTSDAKHIISASIKTDPLSIYDAFLHYETKRQNKTIPCEQTPRYLFFSREIMDSFPEAIIINIVRDPRDVMLSQKNKWKRRFLGARNIPMTEALRAWVNYHPYTIARLWVSAIRLANEMEEEAQFITIRFEDLLQNPNETMASLCDAMGITFEETMLQVPQVGSSMGKDKADVKGINSSYSGNWSAGGLSDLEVTICERTAKVEMQQYGYIPSNKRSSTLLRLVSMLLFSMKILLALAMNLSRTKNIKDTLFRRLRISNRKKI